MLGIQAQAHDFEQDIINSLFPLSQPDPFVLEPNLLKETDNEPGVALSEIKALRATEALKEKALEELNTKNHKLDENLRISEKVLEQKNLEIRKLAEEKKEALAAQFAAEAALRRLHESQNDDDDPLPVEAIIAPLEADIKIYKAQIAALREDNKALERLTKFKETALLETERILRIALERALIVEEIQNQNLELKRQIEICQEENRILEKANRQKVLEVEKLSQTIQELEEAVLSGGAAANIVRDHQRQISELKEEKRTLERELARAKVSANRVATVLANEWKDENDKVMPVRQWLEQRRLLQAEMQRLKDKLAVAERTAKAEAQLKDKFKLRLKTLEDGLKHEKHIARENMVRKSLLSSRSIGAGHRGKENSELMANTAPGESKAKDMDGEDVVSGFLYDRLQKDVISLRKACQAKDDGLKDKEEEIKTLLKKIEALNKAIELEARKVKKQMSAAQKATASPAREDKKPWGKTFLKRYSEFIL
ncbi:hypothetical protein Cgig2_005372 [Carnegiea gigantea]|uniref:Uncharacterized protein n=1 Tax=Carnegiea gigantea TaxID=171969 RepID=A0A9Q1K5G8_9CARY|nr:hypothetical protein Cgig2_005372 [Carnegiea gigantea]